jgi:hypothetical protein
VTRIFRLAATLGFLWKYDDGLTRTKAYEDVGNAIDDVMSAYRGVAKKTITKASQHQGYGYHDEPYVPCAGTDQ